MTAAQRTSTPSPQGARERLLQAATAIFARKGYAAASVGEIVAAAQVTRPVLYYYFRSKEQLYLAILHQAFAAFVELLAEWRTLRGSATHRLLALCDRLFALVQKNVDVLRMLNANYYGPSQGAPAYDFERFHRILLGVVQELMRAGMRAGEFRHGRPRELALVALGPLHSAIELEARDPAIAPGRTGLRRLLRLVLRGIAPQPQAPSLASSATRPGGKSQAGRLRSASNLAGSSPVYRGPRSAPALVKSRASRASSRLKRLAIDRAQ